MSEPETLANDEMSRRRQAFYGRIGRDNLAPLWEVFHDLVARTPKTTALPAHWHYDAVRPLVLESGGLITAKEAERRVLVLENPGLKGKSQITQSLYAGLQLILPGEVAPAHRHTQSALRFIVEGEGAYTAVDGERTNMHPGDFVITPAWTWHDHGNDGDEPVIWLDGLDVPIVGLFNATFAEGYPEENQAPTRPEGDALARYGSGLLPVDHHAASPASPVFNYPYARTREALEAMRRAEEWDRCHGLKLKFVNPASGGHAMPTMATFMQLLPKGFTGKPYRSSDGAIFQVVEGHGRTRVGDAVFEWGPRDVFVLPNWHRHVHEADADAVLFSFSDRPLQEAAGIWREERGQP
jgi:gentisate 1,2-dioxygenase